ncbi:MAG: thiamine phosphate synthase [Alphaproteobacteria bacterium]|nr:thiamine phosphate synthase [Alphaproteobacteria bacterium]
MPSPPLLVISDRSQAKRPLLDIAEAVFRAGGRWFSLREKDMDAAARAELLRHLVTLGRRYDAKVTIHDDLAAAQACGADGVHLPSAGDPAAGRKHLPRGLIGVSAHSPAEAAAQIAGGADYATLSPIFLTASKPGYGPAVGLTTLADAALQAPGRIVALGGIAEHNLRDCLRAGAAGVAVMGEVMRADDPGGAVARLIELLEER